MVEQNQLDQIIAEAHITEMPSGFGISFVPYQCQHCPRPLPFGNEV